MCSRCPCKMTRPLPRSLSVLPCDLQEHAPLPVSVAHKVWTRNMIEVESVANQGTISRPGAWSFPDCLEVGVPGQGTLTWQVRAPSRVTGAALRTSSVRCHHLSTPPRHILFILPLTAFTYAGDSGRCCFVCNDIITSDSWQRPKAWPHAAGLQCPSAALWFNSLSPVFFGMLPLGDFL